MTSLVLTKIRSGDRDVAIDLPDVQRYAGHQPVLVDDIISTGHTMLRTAEQLVQQGLQKPLCIGVHAVFAEGGAGCPSGRRGNAGRPGGRRCHLQLHSAP